MFNNLDLPKILFIKGVFKKDCITDDIFDNKYIENMHEVQTDVKDIICSDENNNYSNYEKLQSTFTTLDIWPKTTNLHCWYCTLQFNTMPVFIPNVIEPIIRKSAITKKYTISRYGVFCSFGCAYHHIVTRKSSIIEYIEQINKLKFLHRYMHKKDLKDFDKYPNPYDLQQYGGDVSPEEFKNQIELCNM